MTVFRSLENQTVVKAVNVACYVYASHGPNIISFKSNFLLIIKISFAIIIVMVCFSCFNDWLNRLVHFLKQTNFDQPACTCLAPVKFSLNWWTVSTGFKCYFNSSNSHMKDEAVQVSFTTWTSLHCFPVSACTLRGLFLYFSIKTTGR